MITFQDLSNDEQNKILRLIPGTEANKKAHQDLSIALFNVLAKYGMLECMLQQFDPNYDSSKESIDDDYIQDAIAKIDYNLNKPLDFMVFFQAAAKINDENNQDKESLIAAAIGLSMLQFANATAAILAKAGFQQHAPILHPPQPNGPAFVLGSPLVAPFLLPTPTPGSQPPAMDATLLSSRMDDVVKHLKKYNLDGHSGFKELHPDQQKFVMHGLVSNYAAGLATEQEARFDSINFMHDEWLTEHCTHAKSLVESYKAACQYAPDSARKLEAFGIDQWRTDTLFETIRTEYATQMAAGRGYQPPRLIPDS